MRTCSSFLARDDSLTVFTLRAHLRGDLLYFVSAWVFFCAWSGSTPATEVGSVRGLQSGTQLIKRSYSLYGRCGSDEFLKHFYFRRHFLAFYTVWVCSVTVITLWYRVDFEYTTYKQPSCFITVNGALLTFGPISAGHRDHNVMMRLVERANLQQNLKYRVASARQWRLVLDSTY